MANINIESLIETCMANAYRRGAEDVLQWMGKSSGEVSERQGRMLYGLWFVDAVKRGDLKPSRIGNGARANKYYSTREILDYRADAEIKAQIR